MTAKIVSPSGPAQGQAPSRPAEKLSPGTYLQYLGFDHTGSVRTYRFRRISRGEESREYVVKADLALFAKHHVAIQEGPTLCLHRLLETPDSSGALARPMSESLTDTDMMTHLASRPEPRAKGWSKRTAQPAGATPDSAGEPARASQTPHSRGYWS
jgi:hypothetical protein